MTTTLKVGDRVRLSDMATRHSRDYYLSQGQPSRRSDAKAWYEAERARRGTVTGISENSIAIKWDDGAESTSLEYRITQAEERV